LNLEMFENISAISLLWKIRHILFWTWTDWIYHGYRVIGHSKTHSHLIQICAFLRNDKT
jgi:hypothetical protein